MGQDQSMSSLSRKTPVSGRKKNVAGATKNSTSRRCLVTNVMRYFIYAVSKLTAQPSVAVSKKTEKAHG